MMLCTFPPRMLICNVDVQLYRSSATSLICSLHGTECFQAFETALTLHTEHCSLLPAQQGKCLAHCLCNLLLAFFFASPVTSLSVVCLSLPSDSFGQYILSYVHVALHVPTMQWPLPIYGHGIQTLVSSAHFFVFMLLQKHRSMFRCLLPNLPMP